MALQHVFLLGVVVVVVVVAKDDAAKDDAVYDIVDAVNDDPLHMWTADYDDGEGATRSMGVWPRNGHASRLVPVRTVAYVDDDYGAPAETFDARRRWPECRSLLDAIKDQSNCGSSWAVSAASVFSDRLCVATGGAVAKNLSAEHLNTCCHRCGDGCKGGTPEGAWHFFVRHGIVTGGDYDSGEGCQPYSVYPCSDDINVCTEGDRNTPECSAARCTNTDYAYDYKTDLYYVDTVYTLPNVEEDIIAEIFANGPVQAVLTVYTDFMYYRSGIYRYTRGKVQGSHAVKILGWGEENGVKYWLCANSWGRTWGEDGTFRILRGYDECGIESRVLAGTPHVPKSAVRRWPFERPNEVV